MPNDDRMSARAGRVVKGGRRSEESRGGSPSSSLGSAMSWAVVMNGGRQVVNLGVTFVLAWMLGPRSFGVVAIAMVYVSFIQLIMQQGLGSALVQRRDLTREHTNTGFMLIVGSAIFLSLVALAASGWWADVNGEPQLGPVVRALTPLLLLRGLVVIPDALLRRDMRFRPLAVRTNVSVLIGGIVGIVVAFAGGGVWALVVQQLLTGVLEVVIVWAAVSWRPGVAVSRAALRDLLSFSLRSTLAGFGGFATVRLDTIVIGLYLGPTVVGLCRFAARLVDMVLESISASIRAVSLPELARLQTDPPALRTRLLFLLKLSSAVSFVPLAALAAAGPATVSVLGDEWKAATGAITIVALAGAGKVVGQLTGPMLQAVGRPGRLAALSWSAAVISAIVLLVGTRIISDWPTHEQVTGLAVITLILHGGVFLVINLMVVGRTLDVRVRELARALVPGLVAGCAGYATGWLVDRALLHVPPLLRVAVVGSPALAVATVVVLMLEPDLRLRVAARGGSMRRALARSRAG